MSRAFGTPFWTGAALIVVTALVIIVDMVRTKRRRARRTGRRGAQLLTDAANDYQNGAGT